MSSTTPTLQRNRGLITQGRAESQLPTAKTVWQVIAHETTDGGWAKTTRAMDVPGGCIVNTTTRHKIAMTCSEAMVLLQGVTTAQLLKRHENNSR